MAETTMLSEDATLLVLPGRDAVSSGIVHALVIIERNSARRRVTLANKPVTIGRAAPSDILIESGLVSRQHCRLQLEGEQVTITDLNSTNGTLVDGERVVQPLAMQHGAVIQLGGVSIIYERRSRREIDEAATVERDLEGASAYVQMLLPKPILHGPVQVNWLFLPCSQLGGNAFGYRFLSETVLSGYMVDVAGQGTEAAMHSVAIMNLLRQQAIPGVDLQDPSSVMAFINATFPQEDHNGMFVLMFYFVLDVKSRNISYVSAGRRPSYLVPAQRGEMLALPANAPAIGLHPGHAFPTKCVQVATGSTLYLFSDSISESFDKGATSADAASIGSLICAEPLPGTPEPLRLYNAFRHADAPPASDEDVSVLVFDF